MDTLCAITCPPNLPSYLGITRIGRTCKSCSLILFALRIPFLNQLITASNLIPGYLTTPTSENCVGKWRTRAPDSRICQKEAAVNENDNHGNPAGRRGLPKTVREPPRVHNPVHAAAPGNRAALLLPAKQEGNRLTSDADRRNHSPARGRQDHGRPVCHQPVNPAL